MRKNLVRNPAVWVILALVLSVSVLGLALADQPQRAAPVYMLPSTDGPTQAAAPEVKRFIVQLEDAPLATYAGGVKGYAPTAIQATGANRLDVNASASRAYIGYLQGKQEAFKAELAKAMPSASVSTYVDESDMAHDLAYQVVFNGVVVTLPKASPQALRTLAKMDGVKRVYRDYEHQPDMYASLPLIGAPTMWSQLGGQDVSGEGMIVASVDTGVYAPNPFFDPTGYEYPLGYPVGNASYTTKKVIGARAYFRPWDPPKEGDEGAWPGPAGSSHGTHTMGTAAGNAGTVADLAGLVETISGVAPKAQILSYRIGYPTNSEFSGSAFSAEIVMAYEDAVVDGADSINYSFGGYSGVMPWADAVAVARDAAWDAGVFVSHSAGNSGPGYSTTWDSSPKVMEVAASSTTGSIASGRLSITAPEPVPPEVQEMSVANAAFGGVLESGSVYSWSLVTAAAVDPANFEGCNPWPADTFTGKAAIISRGVCEFGVKVLNAEQAGAEFVVIYNHESGGDALVNMGGGAVGDQVTIPSVFIYHSSGLAIVDWYDTHGEASALELDLVAFQAGNVPDVIAGFSSRGPAFARFLEPDVTAPGVNILSGGYATGATGVDQHAGFGQASGTSMAAPHVAGAAALIKQMHPDWTPTQIRSALMSTSVIEVWLDADQTIPAGVLDMGAGRIDLAKAGDPGLTFDYPSVSFGGVRVPATTTAIVQATEVAGVSATYDLSTQADEGITASTDLRGITVEPSGTASFELTVEVPEDTAPGDYGGFVWLDDGVHVNHIPFWVRVEASPTEANVLLVDNDMSDLLGFPDYTYFYTSTLESLGVAYDYYNADLHFNNPQTLPSAAEMAAYDVIIYWSGDNYYPNGAFTVATPLTEIDMQLLTDWQFNGGRLLVTGQDLASAWDWSDIGGFLYAGNLGAGYLQDTIFDPSYAGLLPPVPAVVGLPGSPLSGMALDISGSAPIFDEEENLIGWEDGAANQYYVDEVELAPFGDTEAPDSVFPILAAVGGYPVQEGYVASARADSPTLERPQARYDYRSLYLSFGFEGINNDTGYTTREVLMDELLNWLTDEVAVTMESEEGMVNDLITLSADATSSVDAAAVEYRWDFGDGSDVAVSTTPSVVHVYASGGTYTAKVEVTDEYGHKAVDEATVSTIASRIYLPLVFKNYAPIKITIFHTNDEEGWLQPYVAYGSPITEGGAANLMGRFRQIEGYSPDADGFLLLSAGDMWTGPSISTWFQGESTVEVFNAMGYDAAAIGNHEFDFGRDALNERIAQADFPILSANIYYSGTTDLADFTTPYIIKEVNGVKVGIVGLTTTSTPWVTHPKNISDLAFGDYEEALRREVPNMRAEGAEVIIVQAHVCLGPLSGLAESVSDLDIDVMSAGHCSELGTRNTAGTLIIGGGYFMRSYARTVLLLDRVTHDVVDYTQSLILNQYVTEEGNPVTPDPDVQAIVDYWQTRTDEVMGEVIGYTETGMPRGSWKQGNYAMDSWLWVYPAADFAMTNWGGFRASIEVGDITVGDIVGVLPFENRIIDCAITGAQLVDNLECCGGAVAGFTYTYHEEDGQTVVDSVTLADGSPLVVTETYHVMVNDFMYMGGDNYLFGEQDPNGYDTGIQWRQPVIDWTKAQNTSATNPIDALIDDQPRATQVYPVTILQTNDFEGRLETDYKGRGGSARIQTYINQVKVEVGEENVVLVDVGDTWAAAPPISALVYGESTIDIYNMLDYDALGIGNHEYDYGQDSLIERAEQATFPFLSANTLLEGTMDHPVWCKPYITMTVGAPGNEVTLGIIGLNTTETPIITVKGVTDGLEFQDPTEAVLRYYDEVKAQSDALLILFHMGVDDSGPDKGCATLAQELAEAGKPVDLIMFGHAGSGTEEPIVVNGTAIVRSAGKGRDVGRADVSIDPTTKKLTVDSYTLTSITADVFDEDPDIAARVAYWAEQVEPLVEQPVGTINVNLVRDYNAESNMGNLVTDSMRWKADLLDDEEFNGSVDIAFTNPGGLRADIEIPVGATPPFTITWGNTFEVLPFHNTLYLMDLTGDQIQELLDQAASLYKGILQTSGATWKWHNDCQCDTPTTWGAYDVMVNGEPLDPAETYQVVTNNFLAPGGDGWVTFAEGTNRLDTCYDMQEGANDYIQWYNVNVGPIDHQVEGRIVYVP